MYLSLIISTVPAVLAQSPQFYKQMLVGVFDRVFETGPVFRAEKHNTKRHLNEYTSLDFEMGFIDSFQDIMAMETGFLQYTMELLKKDYKTELDMLDITLPKVDEIPQVRSMKQSVLVAEKYNRQIRNPYDLEPEEEALIGRYFEEEYGAVSYLSLTIRARSVHSMQWMIQMTRHSPKASTCYSRDLR